MAIEVFCNYKGVLKYIDGWFGGFAGLVMMDEDKIHRVDGDDRRYVKFAFCTWNDRLNSWWTLDDGPQFRADQLFEFQSAMQQASEWLLSVCKIHSGRFYYIGPPEERKAESDPEETPEQMIERKMTAVVDVLKRLRNKNDSVGHCVSVVHEFVETHFAEKDLYTIDSLLAPRVPDWSSDRCRIDINILRTTSRARDKLDWWTYFRDQVKQTAEACNYDPAHLMRGLLD